jgi:hypothetical protein
VAAIYAILGLGAAALFPVRWVVDVVVSEIIAFKPK